MVFIFVVAACTAGKGRYKVASFVGKIIIRDPVLNHKHYEYFAPRKLLAIYMVQWNPSITDTFGEQ